MRAQNCFSLKEAKYVILEAKVLESIRKSKEWLLEEIIEKGYEKPTELVYAEWSKKEGFYLIPYSEEKTVIFRVDG